MSNFIVKDQYFHKAKREGFRARSVFKLQEIDEQLKLIKPSSLVLDLGCSPGSWLQYLSQKLKKGQALGIDITPIRESFGSNIKTIEDDAFLLNKEKILSYLEIKDDEFSGFDLILSDMAPKTTGIRHVDQLKSLALCEKTFDLSKELLRVNGHLVMKIFQGGEVSGLIFKLKKSFKEVRQLRPKTIRSVSKEFYIVGLNKKG